MIERINLAHLPTPIEALPRLSSLLNGPQMADKAISQDDIDKLLAEFDK